MDCFSFALDATFRTALEDDPPHPTVSEMTSRLRRSAATIVTKRVLLTSFTGRVLVERAERGVWACMRQECKKLRRVRSLKMPQRPLLDAAHPRRNRGETDRSHHGSARPSRTSIGEWKRRESNPRKIPYEAPQ